MLTNPCTNMEFSVTQNQLTCNNIYWESHEYRLQTHNAIIPQIQLEHKQRQVLDELKANFSIQTANKQTEQWRPRKDVNVQK